MDPDHLHILQHTLGLDQYGQPPEQRKPCSDDDFPNCYRNHYVTQADSPDGQKCESLVAQGLMERRSPSAVFGSMTCYYVTLAGYVLVKLESPPPPKQTRAQRRWQSFRSWHDATGLTFKQYLRWPGRANFESTNLI
jgi:hypothetical protein